ncbi:MAG: DUF2269 family protein [Chloroflexi bacterium]|nr:MAG: DUF2269 family protein [Chloroflexota bacterium]
MNWMLLLKSLHVLSAIVAVGSNLTYAVWSARGSIDEAHLGFALRGVKFIDDRIANPAYGVLLVTGLLMAVIYFSITLTWILIGLTGFILVAALAVAVYTPTLTRQIKALDTDGASSPAYNALANRAQAVGMFMVVVVIGIVFVMVFKPLA